MMFPCAARRCGPFPHNQHGGILLITVDRRHHAHVHMTLMTSVALTAIFSSSPTVIARRSPPRAPRARSASRSHAWCPTRRPWNAPAVLISSFCAVNSHRRRCSSCHIAWSAVHRLARGLAGLAAAALRSRSAVSRARISDGAPLPRLSACILPRCGAGFLLERSHPGVPSPAAHVPRSSAACPALRFHAAGQFLPVDDAPGLRHFALDVGAFAAHLDVDGAPRLRAQLQSDCDLRRGDLAWSRTASNRHDRGYT